MDIPNDHRPNESPVSRPTAEVPKRIDHPSAKPRKVRSVAEVRWMPVKRWWRTYEMINKWATRWGLSTNQVSSISYSTCWRWAWEWCKVSLRIMNDWIWTYFLSVYHSELVVSELRHILCRFWGCLFLTYLSLPVTTRIYCIFCRKSQPKPSFSTVLLGGMAEHPKSCKPPTDRRCVPSLCIGDVMALHQVLAKTLGKRDDSDVTWEKAGELVDDTVDGSEIQRSPPGMYKTL